MLELNFAITEQQKSVLTGSRLPLVDVGLTGTWTIDPGITFAPLAEESLNQASIQALSTPLIL